MVLFLLMATSLWTNNSHALAWSREFRERTRAFERDLDSGVPISLLAERHSTVYIPEPEGRLRVEAELYHLHRAGIGPFRSMRENPASGEVAFPVVPVAINQMTWKDGVGEGKGDDPYLVFALPEAQLIHAIHIKCAYERTAPPIIFQVFWKESDRQEFEEERSCTRELKEDSGERTITIPVNETIDHFRIDPDVKPCVIRITKIELLVPTADHARVERLYKDVAYQNLIRHVQEAARAAVAPGAIVLVVSKGDDELLKLEGRKGWHFPQDKEGAYAGNPADSADAVAQLEALRAKGADYLLLPDPAFWWLEEYKGFKQHLDTRYTRVSSDEYCVIYRLSALGENK
jgi:hypothetical protein